jgi:hypothetical protein
VEAVPAEEVTEMNGVRSHGSQRTRPAGAVNLDMTRLTSYNHD